MKENKNSYKREFIRDGRAPIPEKEITSEIMSSIRAKNTKPEIILRKTLYDTGLSGYRLHWKKAPGRPDICYPGKKIAIFVNGCFWHRCPHCNPPMPKTHTHFWENKFAKNIERDKKKIKDLEKEDWKVLVFWECQIKENGILFKKYGEAHAGFNLSKSYVMTCFYSYFSSAIGLVTLSTNF